MSTEPFIRLGLVGWPLTFSASPLLHEAALEACGLPGEYRLYRVPPGGGVDAALRAIVGQVRTGEVRGLNVTIPHKRAVLPLVDELDPTAAATGAVNVIARGTGGRLIGANTDAPGFMADLHRWSREAGIRFPRHPRALVLGAGGAARAVVCGLADAGWTVTVAARRVAQAEELAADGRRVRPDGAAVPVTGLALEPAALASIRADLVVNTTPIGMAPAVADSPWPVGLALPGGAAVYDVIYHPLESALVRRARDQGLHATGGIGMLVEQAALAFERWTGRTAPRERMREALKGMEHR